MNGEPKWERRDRKLRKRRFGMRVHGKRLGEITRDSREKAWRRRKFKKP